MDNNEVDTKKEIKSLTPFDLRAKLNKNPLVSLAGHILFGGGAAVGAFIAGRFIAGVSNAIGFTSLGSLPLGVVLGGITFAGYVGYELLYGQQA